ncbi:site-specific tyrosine recombinase XerD [Microbacterium sp. MPKO10]|uniref:site-specific tyrosine recombinase XerD n=1 Tax=Microbacterium sp. MPKO10 TaxID=2989818 RepID=UPI00223573D1|nr:site-specific tyrosine recombinase XerD [Microbacterium sp. MPKO10]MCW4459770.1 site-specific tyrosine recombinase XerD [Microbacterium sp. MPKO10]
MSLERSIDTFLRHVAIERGLSENTVAAYSRDLTRYREWLEGISVEEFPRVTSAHIVAFLRSLTQNAEKPLSPTSVARVLSSVRSLHRFLLEERVVEIDVAKDVKPPRQPDRLPKAITIAQVEALLETASGDSPQAIRDRALLELLYATGARVSEVCALNVDDVVDTDIVRLTGKGNKQRIVPIGSYARAALDTYLVRVRPALSARGAATPALFLGLRGQRVSRQNAWLIIKAAADRAGLSEHVSPHTLRHSFATHLLQGGADVRVVQELLGHASVATTQIYTLVTADTLRDMYTQAHPRARADS